MSNYQGRTTRFKFQDGLRTIALIQVDSLLEQFPYPDYFPIGEDPVTRQPIWEGDATELTCDINDEYKDIPF